MKKVLSILFLHLFLFNSIKGQTKLSEFKRLADKILDLNEINSKALKCENYAVEGLSVGGGNYDRYSNDSNSIISNFKYVLLFYSYYSKQIKYSFEFEVLIDTFLIAHLPGNQITDFPHCLLKSNGCTFIDKVKAVKLAKMDLIPNSENIYATFIKVNPNQYFWEVVGQDRSIVNFKKNIKFIDLHAMKIKNENIRYINATTGKIILKEEFDSKGYLRIPL